MAKLNGVKTVDMANGEITKVSYDGAEYVKVDGVAEIGDLALMVATRWVDTTTGSFYAITEADSEEFEFTDDVGDTRSPEYSRYGSDFIVFRKVNAQPSELQVGDTVKVSIPAGERPAYGWGGVKNGDVGKVISVNGGDVFVEFTTQKRWYGRLMELVKVAEDGYVRVTDRDPKAGDYVKFTEDGYDVTAGSYYEVTAIDEDGDAEFIDDAGDENSAVVDYETFEVYEKAGVVKAETLNVGDYAKVVNYRLRNGNIVEITETDRQSGLGFTFGAKGVIDAYYDVFSPNQLVKATDAEVDSAMKEHAEAKRKLAPKFNVGDYVKLKTTKDPLNGFKAGQIVKLYENDMSHGASDFKVIGINGGTVGFTDASNLEKVSTGEVAEAKLAEQFTKLGRKPNEFKNGDIAKVIDSPSASPNGTLIEITAVYDAHVIGRGWCAYLDKVTSYGYGLNGHIELIAPVESRVDRQ